MVLLLLFFSLKKKIVPFLVLLQVKILAILIPKEQVPVPQTPVIWIFLFCFIFLDRFSLYYEIVTSGHMKHCNMVKEKCPILIFQHTKVFYISEHLCSKKQSLNGLAVPQVKWDTY